ncbi:GEVED domain-containing protein [Flavobacterium celericrescens]|uniref:T9SS sorting signal type C domain-containing protein n=1 Tax=Flavobacterium celericrescens TaxID=2709780 RepID=A0ABX0ID45_9FLAO|nr:GEVED domain-containing protein [Flavobacterium celericrescens]NHM04532.1 T9SS sorting signal type C domain-containing protein [Flavobacterium celericrescens]
MKQNYTFSVYSIDKTMDTRSKKRKNLLLLIAYLSTFLFGSQEIFAQFPGNDNTPGIGKTFNVPVGVTSVTASSWGGGGGGGGSNSNTNGGNGGGGGGATTRTIAVTGGVTTFTYTVGSGGAAGAAAGGTGGNGTLSSITSASPLTNMIANGGTGGVGNRGSLNLPTNSGGGTASGGTTNSNGLNGTRVGAPGGDGGDSGTVIGIFGIGGAGSTNAVGNPGGTPGAGGGGGENGGGTRAGGAGANGRVTFQYIGVTSITPNPVCVGSTITITGFNFAAGANTVSINGTACTAVVRVNATTITAVVAAGTTSGTVLVTNPNGTNNGQSITVNPLPAAIGGGAATVCTGTTTPAFTNATGGGTWSIINGTGSATINAGGVVTGVTAGNVTVVYTLPTTCSITRALTVQQTPGAIAGGAATVCNGSSTPAFTNPNGGGTWSVVNGTGAATITGGGVLTGTSAGTVTVNYTIGSCTPATYAVTVNPTPAAIGGGSATVCTGANTPAFTNASGGGTWSITNGTGTATISGGGVVTGVTVGTATVIYTIGTCSVSTPITVIATPSITANPADITTTVGGAASFSVTAINGATSYTWQVSTDGGATWTTVTNGGVYSNATTATLNITGATLAMNGYLYQASATNTCGTSSYSTTATLNVYQIVLVNGLGTNNVNCGNNTILRDHNNLGNYGTNRNDWSALNVTSTAVVTLTGTYDAENGFDAVWLYDGVGIGGTLLAVYTGAGTINYTGNPGQTITVRFTSDNINNRPGFEIFATYSGNCNIPCVAPTALPTALSLVPSGTVISGSFTHASPQPDNYLVVISTNPVAPTPVNGTAYAVGGTVGAGYTVIGNGSGNSFSATGLANSTTYYIYIFSFNRLCIGGPLYLGNLSGSTTTTGSDPYCLPTSGVSTRYIENVFTVGNITNLNNMGTGRATSGYADYTASSPVTQIPGGGVAIDYLLRVSRQYVEMWVDWNNDGVFTDAAPELVYNSGSILTIEGTGGFVVPPATLPGNYRIRIKTREDSPTITPCGNYTTGETEDYRLVVVADCAAKPNALYDGSRCDNGTVVLGVEGTPGVTQFRFYDSLYGGTLIGTQAAVPGITNWTTPFLTTTTKYYVTAWNGTCESWYREEIIATINPTSNIIVTPSVPEVCGENNIVQITAGGDEVIDYLVNEDFESSSLGSLNRLNISADANTQWTSRVSPYVPVGLVWKPAITSRAIGNNFALANSDFAAPTPKETHLRTAILDASTYSDLFLSFRHHFSYYPGEPVQFAYVDISIDGGATWPTTLAQYTSNQGYAGQFTNVNIDLTAYAGQPSLMIRFRYYLAGGSSWANGWAIDDIQVYGKRPLNTTFTWSGGTVDAFIDAGCTIPYVAQSVTTVYVRPTALQLAAPSWSFTANATLGNGCPISEFINITNKTKLWIGGTSNDWYNANNWSPVGVPDANTCVYVYDGTFDANINNAGNDALAKIVTVRPSGLLEIQPNNTLTVTDEVTVDAGGTFNIENSGSLIQVNNVANTGTISLKRNVNIRKLDYVYWASPVANFALSSVSPGTTGNKYKWTPTIGANINGFGNWAGANETMVLGKGYIVRGPDAYTSTLSNYTANFVGVPNNGNITQPVSRGTYDGVNYATGVSATPATRDDDNWNLIGNPYPSALNANAFLTLNTNIGGFIKLWSHGTLPSAVTIDPFYNNYAQNYTVADYVTYNFLGPITPGFDGNIGAGQGFFVLMNHSSSATTENVTFNNSMRSNGYRNDLFFKNSNTTTNAPEEKSRIWLDLVSPTNSASRTLVGYANGATNTLDRLYDAPALGVKSTFELFSKTGTNQLSIQGRSLPFDTNDQVPLGITIPQNGIYTIAIGTTDGIFANSSQPIYLEDTTLGIIHDLRTAPYSFTGTVGTNESRFVLRYTNTVLGNEDFENNNSITVFTNSNINVNSSIENIKSVQIFDLLGRDIATFNNVNSSTFTTQNVKPTQSALLVKITLENGNTKTYKVIY